GDLAGKAASHRADDAKYGDHGLVGVTARTHPLLDCRDDQADDRPSQNDEETYHIRIYRRGSYRPLPNPTARSHLLLRVPSGLFATSAAQRLSTRESQDCPAA